ncbi:MAG: hypothetical protein ACO1RX_16650 [Candidatus Sericytochromatia bacterium]
MVEIPVTRTSKLPVWLIPAGLITLIVLIGLIAMNVNQPDPVPQTQAQVIEEVTTETVVGDDTATTQSTTLTGGSISTSSAQQVSQPVTTTTTQTQNTGSAQMATTPQRTTNTVTQQRSTVTGTGAATSVTSTSQSSANGSSSSAQIAVSKGSTATGNNITDVNLFDNTPQKISLLNRTVDLDNVTVTRVLSDRVFTVTSGDTEMFALLDGQLDSAGGNENMIQIKTGENHDLYGYFSPVPSAELMREQSTDLPLSADEYAQLKDQQIYLHVTHLD